MKVITFLLALVTANEIQLTQELIALYEQKISMLSQSPDLVSIDKLDYYIHQQS